MEQSYAQYAVEKAVQLLAIDSPTGFTDKAAGWVLEAFASLGFAAQKTTKGGILIDLGGEDSAEGGLLLQAHTDTLGAMVAEVKSNGRLRVTSLGGMRAETERRFEYFSTASTTFDLRRIPAVSMNRYLPNSFSK